MKSSLRNKLESLARRLAELDATLSSEDVVRDMDRYRALTKEHAEIEPVVARVSRVRARPKPTSRTADEMARDPADEGLRRRGARGGDGEDGRRSRRTCSGCCCRRTRTTSATSSWKSAPERAATSRRFSPGASSGCTRATPSAVGWKVEIVSESPAELGGYKEVILRIVGRGAYSKLKFESGGHRVQRVPGNRGAGPHPHVGVHGRRACRKPIRSPTSTINPADIRIDTFRASGAGGQHINKTDSAVRITHLPTGIVVECQDDRSQHRNRAQAMAVLASRLLDRERSERQQKEASMRKSLVGSGDRSERIRTYNFPQGRVTDHRINLTLYKIDAIMDGDLAELTTALAQEHQAEQLAALGGRGAMTRTAASARRGSRRFASSCASSSPTTSTISTASTATRG